MNLNTKKYRPKLLDDFELDDDNIKILLHTFIEINTLNLLLVGPAGSGKSTYINAIVNEYYKDLSINEYRHNIMRISAVDEFGISSYRTNVKSFCQTRSSIFGKKKIIIIDDADTINEQGQQVFRGYIDKYSSSVHFIMSCSNILKIIENIQSRLFIVDLPPLTDTILTNIMNKIMASENIKMNQNVVDFFVNISNNSIKMLVGYIEKIKLYNDPITINIAKEMCTSVCFVTFDKYVEYIRQGNMANAIATIQILYNNGYSVMDILELFFSYMKNSICLSDEEKYAISPLIYEFIMAFITVHENNIELVLFTNSVFGIINQTNNII